MAQHDTVPTHYLSANALAFLVAGEVGFYYEYWPKQDYSFRVSYGHRFWQPNIIKNGGAGSGIQYYPGKGDAVRLGMKFHFYNNEIHYMHRGYVLVQLNGFYFDSGKYTTREGSNGLNEIPRWVTQVERLTGGLSLGGGFYKLPNDRFFTDYFMAVGLVMGQKKTTDYSYGSSDGNQIDYDPDIVTKGQAIMPILEFGICVGGFWK